jgi:AcrR family transcriptional regulator
MISLAIVPSHRTEPRPATGTRERLLDAAMHLFADRGYERTTIGDIEKAAGLSPRSGALYQYFDGKEDVLHAAVERQLEAVDDLSSVMDMLPLADLRSELTLLARWNLASLERRAELSRFVRREGDQLPARLRNKLYTRLVAAPYEQVVALLEERAEQAGAKLADAGTVALILVEGMAGYRTMRETFGRVPGDINDEQLIETWVDVAMALARARGLADTK